MVLSLEAAARALQPGSRAFLATGRGSLEAFQDCGEVDLTVRVIDDLPGPFPLAKGQFLPGRPPFSENDECQTLKRLAIDTLVVRNSGGAGGTEKIRAAEALGLRIIVVERPKLAEAERVETVEDAEIWVRARCR